MTLRFSNSTIRKICQALATSLVITVFSGCGGSRDDVQRYSLSGSANFDGRPIVAGEIQFCPDEQAGNTGPGSVAEIREGAFKLSSRQGIVGGKYVLKVMGFDAAPTIDAQGELIPGKQLFPLWSAEVELPAGGEFDVNVPATAGAAGRKLTIRQR